MNAPLAKPFTPSRPAVRRYGTLADMPGRESSVEAPPSRRPSDIPPADRLRAKDLAQLENCAPSTARRLMHSGAFGRIYGRNRRDRWIDRQLYRHWLDTRA